MKFFFLAISFTVLIICFSIQILYASQKKMNVETIIKKLGLIQMTSEGDCGGHFKEIYRSAKEAKTENSRNCCSIIYHLISGNYAVPWHKISSDEIFTYLAGEPQTIMLIFPDGNWEVITLGNDFTKGEIPIKVIPAGVWMAEIIKNSKKNSWSLVSVTVSPGFDLKDYIHGPSADIIKKYPAAEKKIKELKLDK